MAISERFGLRIGELPELPHAGLCCLSGASQKDELPAVGYDKAAVATKRGQLCVPNGNVRVLLGHPSSPIESGTCMSLLRTIVSFAWTAMPLRSIARSQDNPSMLIVNDCRGISCEGFYPQFAIHSNFVCDIGIHPILCLQSIHLGVKIDWFD